MCRIAIRIAGSRRAMRVRIGSRPSKGSIAIPDRARSHPVRGLHGTLACFLHSEANPPAPVCSPKTRIETSHAPVAERESRVPTSIASGGRAAERRLRRPESRDAVSGPGAAGGNRVDPRGLAWLGRGEEQHDQDHVRTERDLHADDGRHVETVRHGDRTSGSSD